MGAPAAPDLLVEALLVWLRKSPASILSNASMSSLPRASNKRRTKVLLCSASDDTVASSFLSFCQVAFLLLSGWATTSMMPPGEVGRIDQKLIHRSAWKGNSRKVVCRMPHSPARWPPYCRTETSRLLKVDHMCCTCNKEALGRIRVISSGYRLCVGRGVVRSFDPGSVTRGTACLT